MDLHGSSKKNCSKVESDEEKITCKMKNNSEFGKKVSMSDKFADAISFLPFWFKERCRITALNCLDKIVKITEVKKVNNDYLQFNSVPPLTNKVFGDTCFIPDNKKNNAESNNHILKKKSDSSDKNLKFQCNAIINNEYTLEELIAFATASFDNNLIHPIQTFFNNKNHRITAKSKLHDDVVLYWLKICLCTYPNGQETAFVDTSAFSTFETTDITNLNDLNNRLIMPKVAKNHWTVFFFDYLKQQLEYCDPLKAQNPQPPAARDEKIVKNIVEKAGFVPTKIKCQTPKLPIAFKQNDGFQCGVMIAGMIEATIQGRSLEEFAKTFKALNYRNRMKCVFEYIVKHGAFPFELFFKSENVPVKKTVQNKIADESQNDNNTKDTPTQGEKKRAKSTSAERKQKQRAKMTDEQREQEKIKNKERAAERRKTMDAEKRAKENVKKKEREAERRKTMDAEKRAKEKERVSERRKTMTPAERAKEREKEKKRLARRWQKMTPKQRSKKKKRDRLRKRANRKKRKEQGVVVTAEEKAKHAAAQQRHRTRQQEFENLHCQSRLKRVLKLLNDIKNSNHKILQKDLENYHLLSKNEYARIRQIFSRQKRYGHVHSSILHRYRKIKQVNRHLKSMHEINRFVEKLTGNGKHMEKVSKYTELGVLLAIRNEKQPEDEKEACIQLLRAQHICKKVKSMELYAKEALEKSLKSLKVQLDISKIKWLPDESPNEHLVRVIGRIPYHLKKRNEDDEEFSSLEELYPFLFNEFMGNANEIIEDDNINESDDIVIDLTDDTTNINKDTDVKIDFEDAASDEEMGEAEVTIIDNVENDEEVDTSTIEHHQPMDDEAEKIARKFSQKVDELDEKSPTMNHILDKAVEEDILIDEEIKSNAGPLGHLPLRIMTKIKPCSTECPALTPEKAEIIHKTLSNLCNERGEDLMESVSDIMDEHVDIFDSTLFNALKIYEPCKTGVRSILRRFVEIRTFVYFLARIKLAYETCNYEELQSIGKYTNVPRCVMLANSAEYFDYEEKLTEETAFKNFGVNITAFHKAISENETDTCVICNQLTLPSNIVSLTYEKAQQFMTEHAKSHYAECPEEFKCCKTCAIKINKKQMPAAAVINGFGLDPTSKIEQQLNWIERALCQRVRPIQSIINLRDVSGRYTNIKGKKGALVLLPVPTENTVTHMSNTLPCSRGLTIIVNTTVGKALVRLPLVIEYLTLLKNNNPLYRDIEINENFTFDDDENLIFNKPPTTDQIQALIANNNDEPHLLTQEVDIQPISNVEDESPDGTAFQQYTLLKCPYDPQDINMKHIDALSFPELHTEGNFGFDHARQPRVTKRQYIRNRLKNANRRFATNAKWLTFCQGLLEIKDIKDSISTQARIGRDKLKGDHLIKMMESEDETLQQCMSSQFAALRGHKAYWEQVKLDLKAHIAIFGAPNWFLTLNPSEKDWKELHEAYGLAKGITVTSKNIRDLIAEDPVIWCRHFQRRVREFFKKCILVDNCPLGKVTNYFYRIEYQHRGTEHVHCLLWVEGAPNPGDDEEIIIKYIDDRVTASMPDAIKYPTLNALVEKHQKHWKKHSSTCRRMFKHRGRIFYKCRFEFPRPATSTTRINRFASPLLTLGGGKSKFYSIRRKKGEEQWINDYSPELLLAWQANMDIQYLSSDLMDIVNYVTGYTTKGESAKTESLLDTFRGDHIARKDKFRIYCSMLKQREMGLMEIVDMLMGHQMYRFDTGHVFINSNKDDKRSRILKPKSKIVDTDDAYETNWYDTYYPKRIEKFDNCSLFNLLINFKIKNNKDSKVIDEDGDEDIGNSANNNNPFSKAYHTDDEASPFFGHPHIKAGTAFNIDDIFNKLMVKHRANIPRLYWPKLEANNDEAREDYFRRLIFLFIPWRNESELKGHYDTYEEKWVTFMNELESSFTDAFEDISKIIKNQAMQLEMEREIFEKRKEMKDALRVSKIDEEFEEDNILEVFERVVDVAKHEAAKGAINDGQGRIFNFVMDLIKAREKDKNIESLRMFCSGTAGTGKSYLINLLANELAILFAKPNDSTSTKPATLIAAPTGLAAIQINGSTIHSLLGIDVQHGREGKMKPLSKEALNLKRILFENVKLIIIDEISMVSNIMLAKIHLRLCEFMDKNQLFGGANIIFFGDLLQLPPVKAHPIFSPLLPYQLKKVFDSSAPDFSFWELFDYEELTENMRQKKSLEFAELLGRMRVEALTTKDHEMLRSKIIKTPNGGLPNLEQLVEKYIEVREKDPTVMALFGCTDEVTAFNNEATRQLKLNAVMIEAEDSDISKKSKKTKGAKTSRIWQERRYNLSGNNGKGSRKRSRFTKQEKQIVDKDDQREAAGLVKNLYLAENCRVMLRRNLNSRIGLVNGATGILREIIFENGKPNELRIKFDNIDEEQIISKTSAIFDVGAEEQCCRRQFPVVVAFACTIHKAQGLTLKNVFISTESIFAGGQAFVAFSRVETIDGLYLADYYPLKIYVKKSCLTEYNRLRETIKLPPFAIPSSSNQKKEAINEFGKRPASTTNITPTKKVKKDNDNDILMEEDDGFFVNDGVFANSEVDLHGETLRKFHNSGTDCFLIAAINFLHRILPVVEHIKLNNFDDEIDLLHQVSILFRSPTITQVTNVRQALNPRYHTGYQDCLSAFDEIIDKMDVTSLATLRIEYVKTDRCQCLDRAPIRRQQYYITFTVNQQNLFPQNIRRMSFNDFFRKWSHRVRYCNRCESQKITTYRLENPDTTELNYIRINIHDGRERSLTVTGFAEVTMLNIQWRLIAAVEFFPNPGHFATWVNTGSQWKIINDSIIQDATNLKTNILCYRMLLYQRME